MGRRSAFVLLVTLISLHASLAPTAEARCASGMTTVWPPASAPLVPRPEIVLQGYGRMRGSIVRIADQHPTLVSTRGHRVPLAVVRVQPGDFRFAQAILRADADLDVGGVYQLRINGRPRRDIERNVAQWTVEAPVHDSDAWLEVPRTRPAEFVPYGCGPAEHIPVMVNTETRAPPRYRVRLWYEGTDETTAQVFDIMPRPGDSALRIGHSMCSGPFDPPSGTRVWFRLALVDRMGREVPAPGEALSAVFP